MVVMNRIELTLRNVEKGGVSVSVGRNSFVTGGCDVLFGW